MFEVSSSDPRLIRVSEWIKTVLSWAGRTRDKDVKIDLSILDRQIVKLDYRSRRN